MKLNLTSIPQFSPDDIIEINWYIRSFLVICCFHPNWYESNASTSLHLSECCIVWTEGNVSLLHVKPFPCTWSKTFRFVMSQFTTWIRSWDGSKLVAWWLELCQLYQIKINQNRVLSSPKYSKKGVICADYGVQPWDRVSKYTGTRINSPGTALEGVTGGHVVTSGQEGYRSPPMARWQKKAGQLSEGTSTEIKLLSCSPCIKLLWADRGNLETMKLLSDRII